MARTEIGKVTLDAFKTNKKVTATTLDATNDMYLDYKNDNVCLVVANSDASDPITITIKGAPGFSDLAISIPKSETHVIGNLESAFFKQEGEKLFVNPSAATGTIYAIEDVIQMLFRNLETGVEWEVTNQDRIVELEKSNLYEQISTEKGKIEPAKEKTEEKKPKATTKKKETQ